MPYNTMPYGWIVPKLSTPVTTHYLTRLLFMPITGRNWCSSSQPKHSTAISNWMYNAYLLTYSTEQSPSWEANWFCS